MQKIQKNIEEVISAINAVLQVDVTVIDKHHNRIAATGLYTDKIGEKVAKHSIFHQALTGGSSFIVESPRVDDLCASCERREDCEEYAEVCCPIFLEGQVVGIIGLIAFDGYQRDQIISNKLNLLNFLENMAGLISSKLQEQVVSDKLLEQSKAIEILLNYMDSGAISIDHTGKILASNCRAKKILELEGVDHIHEVIRDFKISSVASNHVFEKEIKGRVERFRYKTKPLLMDNHLKQVVINISQEKDWIHVLNDLVNTKQMITFDTIIGQSESINQSIEIARKSANSQSTVLIQGPSGTGKELFARAIHQASDRRNEPFVAINCAAIPESLIESELFGYVEGAFTGAVKGGKPGKFEIANKGTIFLDEIGDMPIHLQSKLLRVLQEREVERVGSHYTLEIDVRVIAATHEDLSLLIEQNKFRLDLFYRLNVIPLKLDPLRARHDDIDLLSQHFLAHYKAKLNKSIDYIDDQVIQYFKQYDWPGNVREMENVIEYAVNMCQADFLSMTDLPQTLNQALADQKQSFLMPLEDLERKAIQEALQVYGRNKEGIQTIIDVLKISRATLYRKIKQYEL